MGIFDRLLRAGEGRKQRALASLVPDINALGPEMERLSNQQLAAKTAEFRGRVDRALGDFDKRAAKEAHDEDLELQRAAETDEAELHPEEAAEYEKALEENRQRKEQREKQRKEKIEEVLNDSLIEAFAVVREASVRSTGQRHYDVQLMGGAALHFGWIAEMKTGEGKTLVSTLPVYLNAISGLGVHVVTVNDYLASRDAHSMGRVHGFLGLDVGIALPGMSPDQKRLAYAAPITYGTNTEFGFDYLRDNMARSRSEMVQRSHHFAIVDEVDSILIDEARTPLIISGPASESAKLYYQFAGIARTLRRDTDYEIDEKNRTVSPTEAGIEKVERALGVDNLYDLSAVSYVHQLTAALKAKELYHRDKEYIVSDGEVKIVDEFTGRVLDGRRWSDGIHQAVEAKERQRIQEENHTWATVTLQNYFRMYDKLAGMTGTAETEAAEFSNTYKMPVVPIPTHRGIDRADEGDLIYKSEMGKFNAIVADIVDRNIDGQPVLVGTASVGKSEILSRLLTMKGVRHEVLNAKQHAREAEIITQAGRIGAVTVATNMAGRGVDILLGGNAEGLARRDVISAGLDPNSEEGQAHFQRVLPRFRQQCEEEGDQVRELGGLYVLGSERHESRRIDNQLRGRAGRQGDPGESRFYLSLEDELLRLFAAGAMQWVMGRAFPDDQPIEASMVTKAIERAQSQVEGKNAQVRKETLKYDEMLNQQRKVIYARRMQIIDGDDLRMYTRTLLRHTVENIVETYTDENTEWDPEAMLVELGNYYPVSLRTSDVENLGSADEIIDVVVADAFRAFTEREVSMPGGAETMRAFEREAMLRVIDQRWRDHLADIDYLREGINLRAMAQQDPLVAWQNEGFSMFGQMMSAIDDDYLKLVMHATVVAEPVPEPTADMSEATFTAADDPVQSIDSHAGGSRNAMQPNGGQHDGDVPQNRAERRRMEAQAKRRR